jgi:hypothetical protein
MTIVLHNETTCLTSSHMRPSEYSRHLMHLPHLANLNLRLRVVCRSFAGCFQHIYQKQNTVTCKWTRKRKGVPGLLRFYPQSLRVVCGFLGQLTHAHASQLAPPVLAPSCARALLPCTFLCSRPLALRLSACAMPLWVAGASHSRPPALRLSACAMHP